MAFVHCPIECLEGWPLAPGAQRTCQRLSRVLYHVQFHEQLDIRARKRVINSFGVHSNGGLWEEAWDHSMQRIDRGA